MFRITPTEVNSRQSSCLTNFLLSGRSVMLEMQVHLFNVRIYILWKKLPPPQYFCNHKIKKIYHCYTLNNNYCFFNH